MDNDYDYKQEMQNSINGIIYSRFNSDDANEISLIGYIQRLLIDLQQNYKPAKGYELAWELEISGLREAKKILLTSKATSKSGKQKTFNKAKEVAVLHAQRLKNSLLSNTYIREVS